MMRNTIGFPAALATTFCLSMTLLPIAGFAGGSLEKDALLGRSVSNVEKMPSILVALSEAASTGRSSFDDVIESQRLTMGEKGLLVEVTFMPDAQFDRGRAEVAGVSVNRYSDRWHRATMEVSDLAALGELSALDEIAFIKPVYRPVSRKGAATSRAPRAHASDTGSTKYGLTGAGQKVGIVSDSMATTTDVRTAATVPARGEAGLLRNAKNQVSGDLPEVVEIRRDSVSGADEGAAMAELVHDIAPGAGIAFHTAYNAPIDFADGVIDLFQNAGCTVVVDDIGYFDEPFYQDGVIGQACNACYEAGVPYFSAAGNDYNFGYQMVYKDLNPDTDDTVFPASGNDFHQWPNGTGFLKVSIPGGQSLSLLLGWNQPSQSVSPGAGAQIDLDLYVSETPTVDGIRRAGVSEGILGGKLSVSRQGGDGRATGVGDAQELIQLLNPFFESVDVYVAVDHYSGNQDHIPQSVETPVEFRLIFLGFGIDVEGIAVNTSESGGPTTWGHTYAEGVVNVAAVPWYDTPNFDPSFAPTLVMDPQDFTSKGGPISVQFDTAGNFNPRNSFEPDLAASNGNNTTFFGSPLNLQGYEGEDDGFLNFFGTSAAAPNAAAIAALMLELNPDLSPDEIEEIMRLTAIDVVGRRAAPGVDDTTGAGLINAEAALDEVARRIGVTPIPTPTPVPDQQNSYSFPFAASSEGWEFQAPPGFTAPSAASDAGRLAMTASDNTNSFGWWRSPLFRVGAWAQSGDMPLLGQTGADSLYRMTSMLSTNVASSMAPVTRIRTATDSFEQSDVMVISSTGDGSISPTTSGRQYRHYFGMPTTQSRFRSFVDLMNFDPADSPTGAINVESSSVEVLSTNFFDGRLERTWDFTRSQARGWTVRNPDAFASPFSKADELGLRFGPAFNAGATNFSFWGSPETDPLAIALEAGRLYRAVFTVASNATAGQKAAVPAFRLRVNDASNKFSAYVNVESTSGGARVPTGSAPQQYTLWFEAPPLLSGSTLNFSFDYLLVPEAQNDGGVFLYLSDIRVDSYLAPF